VEEMKKAEEGMISSNLPSIIKEDNSGWYSIFPITSYIFVYFLYIYDITNQTSKQNNL